LCGEPIAVPCVLCCRREFERGTLKKSESVKDRQCIPSNCWRTRNRLHSITNCPLSPNECPSSGRTSSHSFVHSLEPSDQGPSQPASPHGSGSTTNRFPLISMALTIECEMLPTRPSTVAFFTPLRFPSRVLNQHPNRRSRLALTSSSCQNLSRSKMSWEKVSKLREKNKKENVPCLGSD